MFQKKGVEVGSKPGEPPVPFVKRIIATGGQTINIDYAFNQVFVDGEPLSEPYIREAMLPKGDMTLPLQVPEGCVFVMGDNRNFSLDSRNNLVGIVDERYILGRVLFRLVPFSKFGKV